MSTSSKFSRVGNVVTISDDVSNIQSDTILNFGDEVEIKASENAKIAIRAIEKDGKKIAEEIFVKKTGRLIALRTHEKNFTLSDDIKIVDARCFPPCVENLTLPKRLRRANITVREPCNFPKCSESVLNTIKAFSPDDEILKERAKKEKKERVSAISAQAIASLSLTDLSVETTTEPVTNPRIGTLVTASLPFDYKLRFFIPKKQKKEEKALISDLLCALRTPKVEGGNIDSKLYYLEKLWEAGEKFQKGFWNLNQFKIRNECITGDFPDDVLKRFLEKRLFPLNCKVEITDRAIKIFAGRFVLLRLKMQGMFSVNLDLNTQTWRNAVEAALKGESAENILKVQFESEKNIDFVLKPIDTQAWQKGAEIGEDYCPRSAFAWGTLSAIDEEKSSKEWLNAAFEGWKWNVIFKDVKKKPVRKVIRVSLPFGAAFVFNLSAEPEQQNADAKKVFAVMSALKMHMDDPLTLFDAVRNYCELSEVSVSSGETKRYLMEFSSFYILNDYFEKTPTISQGFPTKEFLQADLASFFAGTKIEFQTIFGELKGQGIENEHVWSCFVSMKYGEKISVLYFRNWSIFASSDKRYYSISNRDILKKSIESLFLGRDISPSNFNITFSPIAIKCF